MVKEMVVVEDKTVPKGWVKMHPDDAKLFTADVELDVEFIKLERDKAEELDGS